MLWFACNQKPPQVVTGFVNETILPPDDLEAFPLNGMLYLNERQVVTVRAALFWLGLKSTRASIENHQPAARA